MDIDLSIKIGALTVGSLSSAFATWKIFSEMLRNKKNVLRDEYKFAKDFLDSIHSNDLHPYIAQLGYLALAGDTRVGHEEVKHAISLNNPRISLRDYLLGRSCVEYFSTSSPPGFVFKDGYKSKAKRTALNGWYVFSYFITYMAGFSPLFIVSFKLAPPGIGLPLFVFTATIFFPLAYLSLKGASKLRGANSLISGQETCRNSWR